MRIIDIPEYDKYEERELNKLRHVETFIFATSSIVFTIISLFLTTFDIYDSFIFIFILIAFIVNFSIIYYMVKSFLHLDDIQCRIESLNEIISLVLIAAYFYMVYFFTSLFIFASGNYIYIIAEINGFTLNINQLVFIILPFIALNWEFYKGYKYKRPKYLENNFEYLHKKYNL